MATFGHAPPALGVSYDNACVDGESFAAHNGRTATVVIVARGPFVPGRIIDASTNVADILDFRRGGEAIAKINSGRTAGHVEPIPSYDECLEMVDFVL